jgi:hypothetical protein
MARRVVYVNLRKGDTKGNGTSTKSYTNLLIPGCVERIIEIGLYTPSFYQDFHIYFFWEMSVVLELFH